MPNQNKNQNSNSKSVNNNVQGDLFTSKLVRGVPISEEIFDVPASTNQPVAQSKPSHTLRNILYGITTGIILLLTFATFWFYRAAHTTNKTAADYGTTSADIAALTSAKTATANGFVIINGNASVNGSVTANTFSGNGADLSNVNATRLNSQPGSFYQNANNIDSGTLNDARLSGNVVLLGSSPNFTNLLVTGTTTLQDTLAVSGAATFQTTVSVGGDLTVTGDTNINGLTYNWPYTQASGVLSNDGSGNLAWQPVGACASCITDGGNAFGGSISVGTNDANSLYLRTNGVDQVTLNTSGNLGIGVNPGYKLDVNGDVNVSAGNAFRIGGTAICTSGGCAASAGSTDYVQNSASLQTGVNFNFEIASINSVGGIIRAKAGQISDLQQWQSSGGVALAAITKDGWVSAPVGSFSSGTILGPEAGTNFTIDAVSYSSTNTLDMYASSGLATFATDNIRLNDNNLGVALGTVEKLRVTKPTTVDNLANVMIATTATTSKGLVIQGKPSQTGNLQEWQDSTGYVVASIENNGTLTVNQSGVGGTFLAATEFYMSNTSYYADTTPSGFITGSLSDSTGTQIVPTGIYFYSSTGQASVLQLTASRVLETDLNTRLNVRKTLAVNSTGTLGTVEKFRVNTPTTTDNTAASILVPSATTSKGLVVQGVASQTANLQEWQDNTGTVMTAVDSSGKIRFGSTGSVNLYSASSTYLKSDNSIWSAASLGFLASGRAQFGTIAGSLPGMLHVSTNTSATVGAVIRGVTSQTANLQEWQDNSGTVLTKVDANGILGGKNGSGTDSAGAALTIAGGQGTGTGVGGNIVFQYAPAGSTGAALNTLSTACTISGTNGSLSCPGTGSGSERFGSGSTAVGQWATSIGNGASAPTQDGVALGHSATGGLRGTALGASSTAGQDQIAIGQGASGGNSGNNVYAIVIGNAASINNSSQNSIAIGANATINANQNSIVLGKYATSTAANQMVIGGNNGGASYGISSLYLGSGVTDSIPVSTAINATGGSGTNIAGASLTLAGGKGTGTGAGGNIVFQYAPAGSTGAALNTLSTACTISGTNGSLSCPGSGTNSERFGAGATATGTNCVAVGQAATAGSGADCVALGYAANTGGFSNSIAIGRSAAATAANQLVIGSSSAGVFSAFFGNGVTAASPQGFTLNSTGGSGTDIAGASLTLAGGKGTGTGAGGSILFQTAKAAAGIGSSLNTLATVLTLNQTGQATFQNSTNSTAAFKVLDSAGTNNVILADTTNDRVAIGTGTAAPAYTLDVLSAGADATTVAQFKNAGATSCTVQPGGTGFACSSDARLKTNVLTLNNSSDIVNKLRGVSFNWLSNPTGQIQSGFIAQELMQVIPGAVSQDSNGFYVANYSAIVPYLVNAFQDSDKRLTTLEAKVNDIQLSQGVFNGGIVTGDIVFQAKATFDGVASFKGQTVFAGGATFEGVTNVKGRLQLSNNNTGVATIPNGGNSVHVALPSTFSAAPNINLTPQDFVTGQYRVTHVTSTGFDIETSASQSENITFYWQAF